MLAIVLTLTLAAPNVAGLARKNHNARVDDTNILRSTWMSWPGNVPASWPTHQSSPTPSGKEKKWKPCSRNSRIRSDCVACVCGDYGLFVSSSSWRRLPRTSSDWSASSAKGRNQRWRQLNNIDHQNSLYRSALASKNLFSKPLFQHPQALAQVCAVCSPRTGILSVTAIFHQLTRVPLVEHTGIFF